MCWGYNVDIVYCFPLKFDYYVCSYHRVPWEVWESSGWNNFKPFYLGRRNDLSWRGAEVVSLYNLDVLKTCLEHNGPQSGCHSQQLQDIITVVLEVLWSFEKDICRLFALVLIPNHPESIQDCETTRTEKIPPLDQYSKSFMSKLSVHPTFMPSTSFSKLKSSPISSSSAPSALTALCRWHTWHVPW